MAHEWLRNPYTGIITPVSTIPAGAENILRLDPYRSSSPVLETEGATPLTILGSKCKLWLDADLGVVPGATFTWNDQSGTGNHFTQATGTSQPTVVAGPNGHNALNFDGTDDFLAGPAMNTQVSASAYTVWIVLLIDAADTNSATPYLNDSPYSDAGQFFGQHLKSTGDVLTFQSGGGNIVATTTFTSGVWAVLRARHDGTNIYARFGGAAESAGTAAGAISNLTGLMRIGRGDSSAGLSFDGKIAAIITSNAVTTPGENAAIDAYLTARFAA